jgi:hypothetical protein
MSVKQVVAVLENNERAQQLIALKDDIREEAIRRHFDAVR